MFRQSRGSTRKSALLSALVLLLPAFVGGCGSSDEPACDQECQDGLLAQGIRDHAQFLYNQNLAGTPVGAEDVTLDCPLGGAVHITGDTSLGGQIQQLHLSYDMAACRHVDTLDLTLTGVIAENGSFDSTDMNVTYSSDALEFDADHDGTKFAGNCPVSAIYTQTASSYSLRGTVCGRSFER